MKQCRVMIVAILMSLAISPVWAQERPNLVTSHQTQPAGSGGIQINFKLSNVPEQAILSFGVRFEPRFV